MVMLETNFTTLKKLVGKPFTKKELDEVLFNLGMELEEVNDIELKIDITAERPDMVSTYGLARVLKAYYGLKNPEYKTSKAEKDFDVFIDKNVSKVRPFTACAIIKNISFSNETIKEIIWVQEKLHATFGRNRKKVAIGIYPLEHITLPIYYNAATPDKIKFRPLESNRVLTAKQILEEHKTGKEYKHLLEGNTVYPYFADSKGNILSMPPIINSHVTGRVTENTKEIFIECSGHDLNVLKQTLNILAYLFIDMGGKVYQMNVHYDTKEITPNLIGEKRKINVKYANQILGSNFNNKTVAKLLKQTMHEVIKTGTDNIEFITPPIRTDIWHDIDVVDDLLRAYGVNNLKPIFPQVATIGKISYNTQLKKTINELMIGLGFHESFTLSLTSEEDQYIKMNLPIQKHLKLCNSVEEKISMVRTWLLPELIKTLVGNRNREYPQNLFEINDVVIPDSNADVKSKNVTKFSCVIARKDADFTKAKQVITYIAESLGKKISFEPIKHASFIEGRTAQIFINNKNVGVIGEINPAVLTNYELEIPVTGFEIEL